MPARRYDYYSLEQEFVADSNDISIRELGRKHGIPDGKISSLHAQAKKKDAEGRNWYDKRAQRKAQGTDKTIEKIAELDARRALRQVQVMDNAIEAINDGIENFRAGIKQRQKAKDASGDEIEVPVIQVHAKELRSLLDAMHPLFGRPSFISEERGLNVNVDIGEPDEDTSTAALLRVAGLARERSRAANARPVGSSPLPDAPDALSAQQP